MIDQAARNSHWIVKVRICLQDGYGVEDISLMLNCSVEDVRREVEILRESNLLALIYGAAK